MKGFLVSDLLETMSPEALEANRAFFESEAGRQYLNFGYSFPAKMEEWWASSSPALDEDIMRGVAEKLYLAAPPPEADADKMAEIARLLEPLLDDIVAESLDHGEPN